MLAAVFQAVAASVGYSQKAARFQRGFLYLESPDEKMFAEKGGVGGPRSLSRTSYLLNGVVSQEVPGVDFTQEQH